MSRVVLPKKKRRSIIYHSVFIYTVAVQLLCLTVRNKFVHLTEATFYAYYLSTGFMTCREGLYQVTTR